MHEAGWTSLPIGDALKSRRAPYGGGSQANFHAPSNLSAARCGGTHDLEGLGADHAYLLGLYLGEAASRRRFQNTGRGGWSAPRYAFSIRSADMHAIFRVGLCTNRRAVDRRGTLHDLRLADCRRRHP